MAISYAVKNISSYTRSELRASHAGETGAVWIYRGILFINFFRRDMALTEFAKHHLATEKQHLQGFEEIIHAYRGSALLLVWMMAGFITGALPALFGRNWVYYTVYSVESFVDSHYRFQIKNLSSDPHPVTVAFLSSMRAFHSEEQQHRDQALQAMTTQPSHLMRLWGKLVHRGSATAVKVAKLI